MEFSMVNSSSFGSERNGNPKASCMQTNGLHNKTSSPLTASSATQAKNEFNESVDSEQITKSLAVEPTPSQTKVEDEKAEECDYVLSHNIESSNSIKNLEPNETKKSLFCSLPLEKVQTILSKYTSSKSDGNKMKGPRKVLCLYCDRTFVNVNLRQKHVERCHSSKQLRRVSLRKHQNFLTSTPCIYCDKFTSTEHTLKDLFKHLVENHSNKYFGCVPCEIRFLNSSHLADHNALCHDLIVNQDSLANSSDLSNSLNLTSPEKQPDDDGTKSGRKKQKIKKEKVVDVNTDVASNSDETKPAVKNLRSKKLSVKSSRMILKRSKRLQAKVTEPPKRKRRDLNDKKKKNERSEQTTEKSTKPASNFINPYPEFDHFFQVKKITDHSIDNLKISSLTFDDVFDKAFFNRIKCNIQENLLHHIDGKLFKNEESESRISNFEKISNIPQETQNLSTENYGCEISLNAVAPTTMLLSNQLGDDPESQIEYGSKPSKKKTQIKKDEVHYKYFTRRKYQASILEHKENRDLSKLDMWTQYVIKNRQQKILDDKKSPKEILDYFAGEEYKSMMRREELNRILDRRGPFEDLKEEVSKKAALDKMNGETNLLSDDHFTEIGELLNDILNRVFELARDPTPPLNKPSVQIEEVNIPEIPSYLNLRPTTSVIPEDEIDRSDKIALICSSQETENFELPSNTVREKNEKVELTGEWARSRIYVCAACGLKLQNIKQFLEHKSASHQYIWIQQYEFVGNQSELYRHLSIPVLGKVGVLENVVQCKVWKRSDARSCTKCGKQCNSLGELHRHILECGGDWTWMLVRKKCKYRPFGAKSRRKRRGLVKRIYAPKTEPSEKKVYKKSYDIPRQKPSDADTIKRMLANLPAKRATRKIISLKDGFNTTRTRQVKTTQQTKFKCGKLIRGKTKEQNTTTKNEIDKTNKNNTTNNNHRRSLRSLNKVLTSRILDTNNSLIVRRKCNRKIKNEQKRNIQPEASQSDDVDTTKQENSQKVTPRKVTKLNNNEKMPFEDKQTKDESKSKRSSPRIEKRLELTPNTEKMNIKRFFPVKKRKTVNNTENQKTAEETTISKDDSLEKETNVSTQKNLNLRKRKNESAEVNSTKKNKVRKTATTRTRRRRAKTVPTELNLETSNVEVESKNCEEKSNETEEKTFFEENDTQKNTQPVTTEDDNKPVEVEKESVKIENPQIKEETDTNFFSKENNSEFSEIHSQPFRALTSKKKVRKPARGLNDCIAMLTSKLGKSFEESTSHNVFNDEVPDQKQIDKNSEFILKVPFSNEHFQLRSSNKENECLQTSSNFSKNACEIVDRNIENDKEMIILSEKEKHIEVEVATRKSIELTVEENEEGKQSVLNSITEEQNIESIEDLSISDETETCKSQEKVELDCSTALETNKHISDSEDEVPLSNLLKDESSSQCTTNNNFDKNLEDLISPVIETKTISPVPFFKDLVEEKLPEPLINSVEEKLLEKENTSLNVEKINKKKDASVLMEINDNYCETSENLNTINIPLIESNISKIERKILEDKLEEPLLVPTELPLQNKDLDNNLNDSKDVDFVLEKSTENSVPKLDKFHFFTNSNIDKVIWKESENEVITDEPMNIIEPNSEEDKKISADTSEYKENSCIPVEDSFGKQKRKRGVKSNKTTEIQKTEFSKLTKKSARNAKTKALDCLLDDVLLEFSENELLSQDSLKNNEDSNRSRKSAKRSRDNSSCAIEEKPIEGPPIDLKEESLIKDSVVETIDSLNESSITNEDMKSDCDAVKELRRSSRNSKKVVYNETDLIDPLLDDIENNKTISKIIKETTKDMFTGNVKRKVRKLKKNGEAERRLNGEELFDLLKATPNENIVLPKPTNTFFNSFDEISNDFNDDHFDVFDDILEKSIAVIEENLSDKLTKEVSNTQTNLTNEQSSDSNTKTSTVRSENKRFTKRRAKRNRQKNKSENDTIDSEQASNLMDSMDTNDLSQGQIDSAKNKIYCDICDKSFCRVETLTKHKRTLTHISKLSELEAKEAALKAKCDQLSTNEETAHTTDSREDLNLLDMLGNMNEEKTKEYSPFSVNNTNLKLADIINDVLNKPLLKKDEDSTHNFPEIVLQDKTPTEVRRCKSLAERKSFDSENCVLQNKSDSNKNVDYFESEISNAAAGTILEKQLTLLENIIENRSSLGYIDELSVSSSPSINDNVRENDILETKQNPIPVFSPIKENIKTESFIKPSQYDEISEDSNLRNYDEQKSRKVLNRDEELFLECCSLLKSGSEVSNYSKKSKKLELKRCESDWLENNCISQKENENFDCYSDNSRIRTPLGDSFSQEDSNSATISSQWEMNSEISKKENWKDDLKNKNLSFEEVFSKRKNEEIFCGRDKIEELHTVVSSFDRVISAVLKTELKSNENYKTSSDNLEEISCENKDFKDAAVDGKKMLTKGAMKVFEGLKVSIPTEELNMDKLLESNSPGKSPSEKLKQKLLKRNSTKSSKPKSKHKSPNFKKQINMQMNSKSHDVYDFEETQDNSDIFTKPDFRSFRTISEKSKKTDKVEGSDEDSRECADNFSFDALSSSTSSVSEVLPVKSRNHQNITKKKCMIMGRIFKNAVKSRITDEDIRNIPVIDNTKLVEDFVMNCPEPDADKKPRMTEDEMNQAFDKLLSNAENKESKNLLTLNQHKNNLSRRRQRSKNKKRVHTGSDSSDDEFKLQKYSKKRHKKKNNNTEESCINLEQELKECIGVASRKSQRKCTSGKQNVLIEYWSSDESSFEAILEKKIVESVQMNFPLKSEAIKELNQDLKEKVEEVEIPKQVVESEHKKIKAMNSPSNANSYRRKRVAANPLYHWSSSSEDESRDLIEIRPARDELEDDEDRPVQHGWIVGDSPKKLVTMLAQAKGKKCEVDSVKEHGKKRTNTFS